MMNAIPSVAGESTEQYKAAFQEAAVGLAKVALDGTFLEVNKQLCCITGFPEDELLGLRFQQITQRRTYPPI
jgi:PAS domain S-box-containing protein